MSKGFVEPCSIGKPQALPNLELQSMSRVLSLGLSMIALLIGSMYGIFYLHLPYFTIKNKQM